MSKPQIDFTPELIDRICDHIADGTAIAAFAGKKGLPTARTIYRRMASDSEFAKRIMIEREAAMEAEMERCIELADSATPETVHVIKLQIWARHWRAARMLPKRWGGSPDVIVNNATPTIQAMSLSPETDQQLKELIAQTRERVAINR